MNKAEIIQKMLERAGLHVHGIYDGFIVMEDPACVTRGFQNFMNDAWIAVTIITGFMIMIWGIAKIRGAKLSEFKHFKTLIMILLVLSLVKPILNLVYHNGDLMGMTCKEIKVNFNEVETLLSARVGANADSGQYEDIDIYDSGPVNQTELTEPTPPDIDHLFEEWPEPEEEIPGESLQ